VADVDQLVRRDELLERAKYLKEKTDFAVVGRFCDSYGPLERCSSLHRMDQFMINLGKNPEFVTALIDKVTNVLCRLLEIYLDTAGPYLDVNELPGDDYAAANPLISSNRLCFWGAIDIKQTMQGSIEGIEAEMQERMRVLAPGGGYVLAPANHLQSDVPARNVIALFEAARKYGRY
jgi:uroporphyrinogen-III decarboxylase